MSPTCTKSQAGCHDCVAAAQREHHDFTAGCRSCCARAAARLPQARKQREGDGFLDRSYRRLLDQFDLTHPEVRAAAAADRACQISASKDAR